LDENATRGAGWHLPDDGKTTSGSQSGLRSTSVFSGGHEGIPFSAFGNIAHLHCINNKYISTKKPDWLENISATSLHLTGKKNELVARALRIHG
jgi:hypothetical protein